MTKLAFIGGEEHAALYSTVMSRLSSVDFAAVVHADSQIAHRIADTLSASITANSLDDLINHHIDEFDAVLILEHNDSRTRLAIKAAETGKHVLVASMLAPSVQSASTVISACQSVDVRLMAGNPLRFMPSQQAVKAALTDQQLGEPGLLRIHNWSACTNQNNANEIIMLHTVHSIDVAMWLFGGMATNVYAVSRPGYVQVHLGFPHGGMALLDDAQTLPKGDGYFSLSMIGSTGAAYADDHHNRNLLFQGGNPNAIEAGQGNSAITAQLQEFVTAIEEGREPSASGADSRAALQVAEAAVASLQSQQALRLIGGAYEVG